MKKMLLVVVFVVLSAASAFAVVSDKLLIKDSLGTSTVFKVNDAGQVILSAGTSVYDQATRFVILANGNVFDMLTEDGSKIILDMRSTVLNARDSALLTGGISGTHNLGLLGDTGGNGDVLLAYAGTGKVGVGTKVPTRMFSVGNTGAGSDGSTWFTSSSREYKDNVQELSAEKALETVRNMTPVTFVYKNIPDYNHVGFIAEDVPNLVATPDRKSLSAMDIVAVLTKVVQEQNKQIDVLAEKISKLEKENSSKGRIATE